MYWRRLRAGDLLWLLAPASVLSQASLPASHVPPAVWQSEASVQAAVQALTPQMTENKKRAEDLLREAMLLQVGLFVCGAWVGCGWGGEQWGEQDAGEAMLLQVGCLG